MVVDPTDPLQQRWFAAVSTEFGATRKGPPYRGGLYWSQNRGLSWERLDAIDCDGGQSFPQSFPQSFLDNKLIWRYRWAGENTVRTGHHQRR